MTHTRPKLLIIGHAYVTAYNRRKLNPLADYFDITCVTWSLDDTILFGMPLADFDKDNYTPRYELIRLPVWPSTHSITRYLHFGLADVIRCKHFDAIFVDSEPWSLIRWQTWLLKRLIQPKSKLGEFSWENVKRAGFKGRIHSLIYRLAVRTQDFCISGNQACRDIFLSYGADPNKNLVAAQLGVECTDFRPASSSEKIQLRNELGIPDINGFLIGFCGRFVPEKGLRELLAALIELRKQLPTRNLNLALLGHGELKAELTAFAEVNPWLHLLNPRPHREVAAFMRSLDLFVLPSKPSYTGSSTWEEQFGHVLIEAMAARVPTLGSSSGAIPEIIAIPEAIFNHSDIASLTETMHHWISDDKVRDNLASAQQQLTIEKYSHEALAHTWAEFILRQLV